VKEAAHRYLDMCLAKIIQWFINRSQHFMSAYQLGLTGKVVGWAVRETKQHYVVSGHAMMAIDMVLNLQKKFSTTKTSWELLVPTVHRSDIRQ
jgi:hypothetical protein